MADKKLRSINTHFWDDAYIQDSDPIEKLLFLYLLTNTLCNLIGVYEIQLRRIAFDTGIDKDMIEKILNRFKKDGKLDYIDGYIILHNFVKNQSYNKNMITGAKTLINNLPETVRKGFKGFETVRKVEVEVEVEYEVEVEVRNNILSFFQSNNQTKEESEKFINWNIENKKQLTAENWKGYAENWIKRIKGNEKHEFISEFERQINEQISDLKTVEGWKAYKTLLFKQETFKKLNKQEKARIEKTINDAYSFRIAINQN